MSKRIGFIGLGNMGYAIFKGLDKSVSAKAYDLHPRKDLPGVYVSDVDALVESSDVLILCVKPVQVPSVLSQIKKPVSLISIAAGIPWEILRSYLPKGSLVVRTMPNLPLMVGKGSLGYFGDPELYPDVEAIFQKLGVLIQLPREELLDAVTGLSGSGPAFVFSFLHAMAEGGVKSGLTYPESLELAAQTILGSVEYFLKERDINPHIHPMELRNRVSSPGGTTIHGLSEWEKQSVSSGVMESVYKAYLRSQELGKS